MIVIRRYADSTRDRPQVCVEKPSDINREPLDQYLMSGSDLFRYHWQPIELLLVVQLSVSAEAHQLPSSSCRFYLSLNTAASQQVVQMLSGLITTDAYMVPKLRNDNIRRILSGRCVMLEFHIRQVTGCRITRVDDGLPGFNI